MMTWYFLLHVLWCDSMAIRAKEGHDGKRGVSKSLERDGASLTLRDTRVHDVALVFVFSLFGLWERHE